MSLGMTRVEIVPDNDADADPRIPKDILENLEPDSLLISKVGHMMYVRKSHWDKIKVHFKEVPNQ